MKKLLLGVLGLIALLAAPAFAGTVLWSTQTGDINFQGLTPTAVANMAVQANTLTVDTGTKTATATGTTTATATLNKNAGVITSASLTTAAGGTYTLTLTDSAITAADQVMASVGNGSNTGGTPTITTVTPGAGSVVIQVQNINATTAFNGTIKISFVVFQN